MKDQTHRARLEQENRDQALRPEDLVLSLTNFRGTSYEGTVKLAPGSYWFIIQNNARLPVDFHLEGRLEAE